MTDQAMTTPDALREAILGALKSHRQTGESEEVIARDITTAVRAILALTTTPLAGEMRETWRHVKRGTVYDVIGHAELQDAAGFGQHEHACLTIYRGEDGKLWARNSAEFTDGRFEQIVTSSPTPSNIGDAEAREALEATGWTRLHTDYLDKDYDPQEEGWRIHDMPNGSQAAHWICGGLDEADAKAIVAIINSALAKLSGAGDFQSRVAPWMRECFGPEISADRIERGDRFLEESLELLQSGGYDRDRVALLVDYVWGRPVGEPSQEVGGVGVTLAAYCLAFGLDMQEAFEAELARILRPEIVAKIRLKQATKAAAIGNSSPLPVAPNPPKATCTPPVGEGK